VIEIKKLLEELTKKKQNRSGGDKYENETPLSLSSTANEKPNKFSLANIYCACYHNNKALNKERYIYGLILDIRNIRFYSINPNPNRKRQLLNIRIRYNPQKNINKHDENKLRYVVGGGFGIISIILGVYFYFDELPNIIAWIYPWGIWATLAITAILTKITCYRKKQICK